MPELTEQERAALMAQYPTGPTLADLTLADGEQTVYFVEAGEWCFLRTPPSYVAGAGAPPTPCVLHCHGNGGYVREGDADWLVDEWKVMYVEEMLKRGIAVAESNACGAHWGHPNAVAATAALAAALPSGANVDAANLGIWGGGLGGALVWNCATGPLLGKLKAAAMQQATLSYDSVIRDHQFKDQLLVAYGMPPDADDDIACAALRFNDPLVRTKLLTAEHGVGAAGRLLPEAFFLHGDLDDHMW